MERVTLTTEDKHTVAPSMRITRIDLDGAEMPSQVSVRMTWDVWDRLCRDHKALRSVAQPGHTYFLDGRVEDWWADQFPITWVGATARFYGAIPGTLPDDGVDSEIYRCLSSFCCRFWEGGVNDVPSPSEETP